MVPREVAEGRRGDWHRSGRPGAPSAARRAAARSCPRWTAPGSCRTTWAPSSRPRRPMRCCRPANSMRARAKACGHCVSVTTPKRNGRRSTTGPLVQLDLADAKSAAAQSCAASPSTMPLQVADGARRAAQCRRARSRTARPPRCRRSGPCACICAMRFEDGREAHLALARAAPVGVVHLHMGDVARRHPAAPSALRSVSVSIWPAALQSIMVLQARRIDRHPRCSPPRATVLMQVRLARRQRLDAVDDAASRAVSASRAKHSVARASACSRLAPGGTERCFGEPCTR